MPSPPAKDFFISYNKADRAWAEWIAWQLEQASYSTILQAWDFRPGSNFVLEMQKAASEAQRTIAVLSPDYLTSLFTQPEWAAAFAQDPTGEKGTLLPVRVRQCKLDGLLAQIIYIDLVGRDEAAAREVLVAGVRHERYVPSTAPRFPPAATGAPRFPGALPEIWNLPHLRNPNFTGRDDLLTALRDALASGRPAALTQAIHGLGGVGKTQLAVEYAYRHAAEYSIVWWIRSEEPATLVADYAALAERLGLVAKDSANRKAAVETARLWLSRNADWLLIFDNASDPAGCRPYLPAGAAGHVLVTSRNPAWRGLAEPLPVQVLPRQHAVEFLLKRSGQQNPHSAAALCEALGDLPLALEQAGAYIETTPGISIAGYLSLFQSRTAELLHERSPSTDYPRSVAATFQLSLDRLREEAPAALDMLHLLAYLAPDDIPRDLVEGAAAKNPLEWNRAVAALRRYSLAELRDDAFALHRLVQAVIRASLSAEAEWAERAMRLLDDAFPFKGDKVETWTRSSRLLPHALAAATHAEALAVAQEATGRLLNQAGLYLLSRAQLAEAEDALLRALAIGEKVYGPEHPTVAIRANNIGTILKAKGDLEGALRYSERALAIDEKVYGPEHPTVAIRANNIGQILQDKG
ncbi:MAG: TIR domain-containing protein, partial [Acidobacteria bacterium]|nr:TIR domain-containing protein [Acidobacteriota bacterium]